jgi:hypothetical protein
MDSTQSQIVDALERGIIGIVALPDPPKATWKAYRWYTFKRWARADSLGVKLGPVTLNLYRADQSWWVYVSVLQRTAYDGWLRSLVRKQ